MKDSDQPMPPTPVIEYSIGLAQEFQAKMDRMSIFVKNHNVSLGSSKETLLREFLSQHAPTKYNVGEGFIYDLAHPFGAHTVSKQCDILVYNQTDFPPVYSDGSIKIVYPDSVVMSVEVKTRFGKKEIIEALDNICSAKRLNQRYSGVIFAFNSCSIKTVIKHVKEHSWLPSSNAPVAILLFDKGIIIHCWHYDYQRRGDWSASLELEYTVLENKDHKGAIVIAFLLLLFFEAVIPVRFTGALGGLLKQWTIELDKFQISQDAE